MLVQLSDYYLSGYNNYPNEYSLNTRAPKIPLKFIVKSERYDIRKRLGTIYVSKTLRKFIENIEENDVLVIEYPMFYQSSSIRTIKCYLVNLRTQDNIEIRLIDTQNLFYSLNSFEIVQ